MLVGVALIGVVSGRCGTDRHGVRSMRHRTTWCPVGVALIGVVADDVVLVEAIDE